MRPSWMPSVGDIIFVLLLFLILVRIPNFIFADGSTGWHLVTGHYILDHFSIPRTDLISYTFPDKPWVAYEWLFDAVIAALDKLAGLKLVAVACCSAIATLFLLLYNDCRRRGCHFITSLVLCIMGALISAIHWLARPHLVTFFGVYAFSKYLQEFYEHKISWRKLLFIVCLTMIVWVNSHPAFLMGIVLVGIYFVSELILTVASGGESKQRFNKRLKPLGICLLAVIAATFLNPYGIELYKYIYDYLHQTAVISQTDEFGSPSFHGELQSVLLELLFFLLAAGLVCTQRKPSLPRFLTVFAYLHLCLASKRNMALFVIVALPFIAELIANSRFTGLTENKEIESAPWLLKLKNLWKSTGATMDSMEFNCTRHALPVVTVIILAISCFNGGNALGIQLVRSDFDPKSKPVQTLAYLKEHHLDANHGFTYDNWGGYIRYKTGMRVFIDDRVDFYGQKFYLDYGDAATIQPDWRDILSKYKIDWVLFPSNSLLAANLKHEPGWTLVCEDAGSCLFVRQKAVTEQ